MEHGGSEAEQQVARLLRTARRELDLSVAFLSRIDESTRTVQVAAEHAVLLRPARQRLLPRRRGHGAGTRGHAPARLRTPQGPAAVRRRALPDVGADPSVAPPRACGEEGVLRQLARSVG